jgi:hypothetical protein
MDMIDLKDLTNEELLNLLKEVESEIGKRNISTSYDLMLKAYSDEEELYEDLIKGELICDHTGKPPKKDWGEEYKEEIKKFMNDCIQDAIEEGENLTKIELIACDEHNKHILWTIKITYNFLPEDKIT